MLQSMQLQRTGQGQEVLTRSGGAGRARVSPFCSPPVPPVTIDLSRSGRTRGAGGAGAHFQQEEWVS